MITMRINDYRSKRNIGILTSKSPEIFRPPPSSSRLEDIFVTPKEFIEKTFTQNELETVKSDPVYFRLDAKRFRALEKLKNKTLLETMTEEENKCYKRRNFKLKINLPGHTFIENIIKSKRKDLTSTNRTLTNAIDSSQDFLSTHFNKKKSINYETDLTKSQIRTFTNSNFPNLNFSKIDYSSKMKKYEEKRKDQEKIKKEKAKHAKKKLEEIKINLRTRRIKEREEYLASDKYSTIIKENYRRAKRSVNL
jgi:hypothetical protein